MTPHSPQFKADALERYVRSGESIRAAAQALGMNHWTLREWVRMDPMASKHAKKRRSKPTSRSAAEVATDTSEVETPEEEIKRLKAELRAAKRENEILKEDREILKKAAAFFAKESE